MKSKDVWGYRLGRDLQVGDLRHVDMRTPFQTVVAIDNGRGEGLGKRVLVLGNGMREVIHDDRPYMTARDA